MGWSVTEDLLCMADDGTVMVYDNYSWRNQARKPCQWDRSVLNHFASWKD